MQQVGADVTKVRAGDHFVLSFLWCGSCANCLRGLPSYCNHNVALNFGGTRPDGSTTLPPPAGCWRTVCSPVAVLFSGHNIMPRPHVGSNYAGALAFALAARGLQHANRVSGRWVRSPS